ncbi:acyl-CoA synthetase [Mycolicibacterium moriokaense]|uniref:Acyl-CoA synthetase n=1 Tax=Mycolicibacterium moriokaense TaxID=39691 RepID=A0AAD1M798_9MYCO|nr:fatty-acid--CoA ligase FadD1 [Mycolicibacterium moriokaense]MCV7038581.1 AMP-binding protein [Mycolicibacterium moriokaense]ORB24769.1 acyl-CoA synthetase [Mycolicibacterium moriokaense]BBX02295.1 acyl-CoA synthetase [Mycolicibacterium moriokaense]
MPSETIQQLLRERATADTVAVKYGERSWTWREHLRDASTRAAALLSLTDHERPLHVGVLMDNNPEFLNQMAAAGLGGYVLCGINSTRRGEALAADIRRADCQIVVTDGEHRSLLDGLDLDGVQILDISTDDWTRLIESAGDLTPYREVEPMDTYMLIFTSGTSGNPKPVRVSHFMVLMSGQALVDKFEITEDDTCYLSMPLFHSNALVAGWGVGVARGAAMAPAKFSASGFVKDIRHYGATYMNYVGKPLAYILATPEGPDDAQVPLRIAFGNEASDRDIEAFEKRFGCTVWDGFGSTENAVIITREEGTPKGSLGKGFPGVAIYNPETVTECPPARFDENGALLNAEEAIGELVNTDGQGFFTGYYNADDATAERLRHGMYWSGDLAYRDADGWIYLAGRSGDWMRVDGENMAAAPIERILSRLPVINLVAVYAVPDENVGDQIMAAIVLNDEASLSPDEFEAFLAAQPDLSPKAWPRYVRIAPDLPTTATHKVLKRELAAQGPTPGDGELWVREERGTRYSRA